MNIRHRLSLVGACLALIVGGVVAATVPANAAPTELFPAIGTYTDGNVVFGGEYVVADTVTINPGGLPRFEVLVQYTNDSDSLQTDNCVLPNGHLKTPSDTWLTIHGVNGTVTLKGIDSTCGDFPRYKDVLAPGQTDTYFVAFPLPPAIGTTIQISSLFSNGNGGVERVYTDSFNPYASTTTLTIYKFQLTAAALQLLLDARDLWTDGHDLVNNLRGMEVFGHESISVLDAANLILPWVACGNQECVLHMTPTPYLPEMSST